MGDAKQYRIKTFPKGDSLWRVDWISGIRLNPNALSEQLITVFFTRLHVSNELESGDPLSNHNLSKDHYFADIGVGVLPLVWIGSVWRNGHLVEENIEPPTSDFVVDTTHAKFIKLSSTVDKGGKSYQILPLHQYPVGIEAWKRINSSLLIALPYKGDPIGLLIPALEVIRFYYIYSSYSARAIFFGQYEKLLREPTTFDSATGVVKTFLHWFCKQSDAWLLARYKASPLMQERAIKIHEWNQLENINKFSSEPINASFFPFDGKSRLTAECKQIVGDDGVKRFIAVRLKRCSAAMPFSDVHLEVEDKPTDIVEIEERKPIWARTWPHGIEEIPKELDHSGEPDKRYFPIDIGVLESRFSDLEGKKLFVVRKKSDKPKGNAIARPAEKPKTGVGTSDGTYGESNTAKGNVRVDVSFREDNNLKTDLDSFIAALEYLRTSESMSVITIPVGEGSFKHKEETISCSSQASQHTVGQVLLLYLMRKGVSELSQES